MSKCSCDTFASFGNCGHLASASETARQSMSTESVERIAWLLAEVHDAFVSPASMSAFADKSEAWVERVRAEIADIREAFGLLPCDPLKNPYEPAQKSPQGYGYTVDGEDVREMLLHHLLSAVDDLLASSREGGTQNRCRWCGAKDWTVLDEPDNHFHDCKVRLLAEARAEHKKSLLSSLSGEAGK